MRDKILLVILIAFLGLGVYLFFTLFERYEEEVNTGFSLKARKNPYLAAERFLKENNVETYSDIDNLDPRETDTAATILLVNSSSILNSPPKIDDILDWVNQGGFLIIGADYVDEDEDTLFARLDLDIEENDWSDEDDLNTEMENGMENGLEMDIDELLQPPAEENPTDNNTSNKPIEEEKLSVRLRKQNEELRQKRKDQAEGTSESNSRDGTETTNSESTQNKPKKTEALTEKTRADNDYLAPVTLFFEGNSDQLSVYFPKRKRLTIGDDGIYDEILYAVDNDFGYHFIQMSYGEGFITVLSDVTIWNSYSIGYDDNAYLLDSLSSTDSPFYIISLLSR